MGRYPRTIKLSAIATGVCYLGYRILEAMTLSPLGRISALRWFATFLNTYALLALFGLFLYKRLSCFGTPLALDLTRRQRPGSNRDQASGGSAHA